MTWSWSPDGGSPVGLDLAAQRRVSTSTCAVSSAATGCAKAQAIQNQL